MQGRGLVHDHRTTNTGIDIGQRKGPRLGSNNSPHFGGRSRIEGLGDSQNSNLNLVSVADVIKIEIENGSDIDRTGERIRSGEGSVRLGTTAHPGDRPICDDDLGSVRLTRRRCGRKIRVPATC